MMISFENYVLCMQVVHTNADTHAPTFAATKHEFTK